MNEKEMMDKTQPIETVQKNKGLSSFGKGLLCGTLSMFAVCVAILFFVGCSAKASAEDLVSAETIKKLEEIRGIIDSSYLYISDIDEDALQEAIIKGYVAGLNEPYTVYYNAEETAALFETTSGTFGGIGVGIMMDKTTGLATFTTIYEGCPGEAAGFKTGDIVYKVNGEDISGMDLDTIVSKIRGEVGTTVEITVYRGENYEEYTGKATRALIENETVYSEMKEGKIGYIQLTAFEDVSYQQFKDALDELTQQGMKGLIIDLRNNTGGNLNTVCQIADLLLPQGTVVSIKDRNGNTQSYPSDEANKIDVPVVVLTNGYSASASEILAGAIQDYKIGTLVGTTTYGKGIVQNIEMLNDGTALKYTSSEYFTPNGRNIHGTGIAPDVEIEYDSNLDYDNQLKKAIEVLNEKM